MPRQQDAPTKMFGNVDPQAFQSISNRGNQQQQNIRTAMQEKGATQRSRIQAGAATAQTAMQVGAQKDMAAERIIADKEGQIRDENLRKNFRELDRQAREKDRALIQDLSKRQEKADTVRALLDAKQNELQTVTAYKLNAQTLNEQRAMQNLVQTGRQASIEYEKELKVRNTSRENAFNVISSYYTGNSDKLQSKDDWARVPAQEALIKGTPLQGFPIPLAHNKTAMRDNLATAIMQGEIGKQELVDMMESAEALNQVATEMKDTNLLEIAKGYREVFIDIEDVFTDSKRFAVAGQANMTPADMLKQARQFGSKSSIKKILADMSVLSEEDFKARIGLLQDGVSGFININGLTEDYLQNPDIFDTTRLNDSILSDRSFNLSDFQQGKVPGAVVNKNTGGVK